MSWENDHIHQTALKHKHITKYMHAVHALRGYDTASHRCGIGKATALKVSMGGHHLIELDQHGADVDKLTSKATTFVAACYGSNVEGDMTTHRYKMWKSNIVDPIRYGWHAGDDCTPLYPTTLTAGVSPAPLTILHLVKCRFFTSRPCSTGRCGC